MRRHDHGDSATSLAWPEIRVLQFFGEISGRAILYL